MAVKDIDKGYKAIKRDLKVLQNSSVTIGIHGSAEPYQTGQKKPINVAQIAAVHEFGSKNGRIPMRSFMRSAVDENEAVYLALIKGQYDAVLKQTRTISQALNLLGVKVQADLRKKIVDLSDPPLADTTIAAKLKAADHPTLKVADGVETGNPLVFTGHLGQSVTFKVAL